MPSAALHKHKEAGSALNPNQGCQQREARLITARGPAGMREISGSVLAAVGYTDQVVLALHPPVKQAKGCRPAALCAHHPARSKSGHCVAMSGRPQVLGEANGGYDAGELG
jgi:hypothetical protein